MPQEWILDVLTDLRDFANRNGLMGIAEQLDDTILVAAAELKQLGPDHSPVERNAKQVGGVSGALGHCSNF